MRQSAVLLACAFVVSLAACGGGGGTSAPNGGVLPVASADPHAPGSPPTATPKPKSPPTATSKPKPTATPVPTRAPAPTPTPVPTATPGQTSSHSVVTRLPNTNGRIGLFQVFDYRNGYMPHSQISQYGARMDAVWGSVEPAPWRSAHPSMLVSQYFIMGLDQYSVTGHALSWWQQHHPNWVLYACTASGAPTHDVAYMSGINVPDVPLDIHNPSAVAYQIGTMAQAAKGGGYNSLAIDQVVFYNIYLGGNPNFGQHVRNGEYGCGTWNGNSFNRIYARPQDPQYTADVVNYVAQARSIAHSYGLTLIVNHSAGPLSSSAERQLLANTDVVMDETGFSAYGRYAQYNGAIVKEELAYVRYAQEHGTGVLVIDKFANKTHVDSGGLEYSLATYLLGNEGGMLLFTGGLNDYGTIQYHAEYGASIGRPCSLATTSASVYSRRFTGGMALVNATGSPQRFTLPSSGYRDIEGRNVPGNTLTLAPNDAYVLLGGSGC